MSSVGEPPVMAAGQTLATRIKGWTFGIGMLLSALFGMMFVVTPLLPLMIFKPRMWRNLLDRLVGIWVIMPGALMSYIFGAQVHVKGDRIEHAEPALIIMNHRTRLDWLFFWNALFQVDPWLCTSEKITLKGILKKVPGAGWAMQAACYIFLDRSFETDKSKLDKILNYYAATGYNYQLLLYPEGTDKCPKATERSRVHAEKKGLVHYDYLLHPRTTGFVHIVQTMRKLNYIKYVYDVTVGFNDAIVQSEVDLIVHGACPKDIHYQVRKLAIDELPESDEGLSRWLVDLWREKEQKLKQFYATPQQTRQFADTPGGTNFEMSDSTRQAQMFIVSFWVATTFIWIFMFFDSAVMFYIGLLACVVYSAIHKFSGGLEFFAIDKFYEHVAEKNVYTCVGAANGGVVPPMPPMVHCNGTGNPNFANGGSLVRNVVA